MDAFERFFDVHLPRLAGVVEPVPVENAVGGVGGHLDFGDEKPCADGVDGAGRQKMTFTGLYRYFYQEVGHGAGFDGVGHPVFCDAAFEAFVNDGLRFGGDDVPAFGFRVAFFHSFAGGLVGMYLDAEDILGIQNFYKQRKRT